MGTLGEEERGSDTAVGGGGGVTITTMRGAG